MVSMSPIQIALVIIAIIVISVVFILNVRKELR